MCNVVIEGIRKDSFMSNDFSHFQHYTKDANNFLLRNDKVTSSRGHLGSNTDNKHDTAPR